MSGPVNPTPVDMMLLLQFAALTCGSVLAVAASDDGVFGQGEEDSPGWWYIPAGEWHQRYSL